MRQVHRHAASLTLLLALCGPAGAEDSNVLYLNQNQSGLALPGVSLPQGSDEIRAADGTTCRSSVSGNGAFVDVGLLGTPETGAVQGNATAYGRVVIPLGQPIGRLDCRSLYELEIQRLQTEVALMRMGVTGTTTGSAATTTGEASIDVLTTSGIATDLPARRSARGSAWTTTGRR